MDRLGVLAIAIAIAVSAACGPAVTRFPPAPAAGVERRTVAITVPEGYAVEQFAGDGVGDRTYAGPTSGPFLDLDWRAATATPMTDVSMYGGSLLTLRGTTYEWPGATGVPQQDNENGAWLAPNAAVPLVVQIRAEPPVLEGWRADGTRAWHVALADKYTPRIAAHTGPVVIVQSDDDGSVLAINALTGAERWRLPPRDRLAAAVAHGDEVALVTAQFVEVVGRVDGATRRRIRIDNEWMSTSDSFGFDGDVLWAFDRTPQRTSERSDMLGIWPSADGGTSPPGCAYQAWDTRHDRRVAVRTEADLPAAWTQDCMVLAMLPLDDGGVQVLVLAGSALRSQWFDHPP